MEIGSYWKGWEVVELLGTGSFGSVFKIVRKGYNDFTEESALKVIRIPQNPSDYRSAIEDGMTEESASSYFESIVEDFSREFTLMSKLKGNSNIVSFEDYEVARLTDDFGWEIFIRMELLTPLTQYIMQNGLTEADTVKIGVDICKALELCEEEKILHRDIKPQNIFVSKHGDFKLGDFGIARKMENIPLNMTKRGTLAYMAPEVYRGDPYTSSVDIYSLGLVLYRLLNYNRSPFMPLDAEKISFNERETARARRLSGEPLPPPANASPDMASIILSACAFDPADRFVSATEMRRALEAAVPADVQEPVLRAAEKMPTYGKAASAYDDDATVLTTSAESRKIRTKRSVLVISSIVAVCLIIAAGSGLFSKKVPDPVPEDTSETEETITEEDDTGDSVTEVPGPSGKITYPEYSAGTISVSTADELMEAIKTADDWTTIELEPGTYSFDSAISINRSNIRLLGAGGDKPEIDCGISISGSNIMLENIAVNVTDYDKAEGGGMARGIMVESYSEGNTYMLNSSVTLRYHGDNAQRGIENISPLYMENCTVDVADTNDDNWCGYICVGMGGKFYAINCEFKSNDVALSIWPSAEDQFSDKDIEELLDNNTFKASTKFLR